MRDHVTCVYVCGGGVRVSWVAGRGGGEREYGHATSHDNIMIGNHYSIILYR